MSFIRKNFRSVLLGVSLFANALPALSDDCNAPVNSEVKKLSCKKQWQYYSYHHYSAPMLHLRMQTLEFKGNANSDLDYHLALIDSISKPIEFAGIAAEMGVGWCIPLYTSWQIGQSTGCKPLIFSERSFIETEFQNLWRA
jgi:hypothetical protein